MMETVSQSSLRSMKTTEESGTLFGVGLRNVQRISARTAAKETLGQMRTQKQLPMVEGVATTPFESTAGIKDRSIISMRDAMTRAAFVQGEAVRSGLTPAFATTPATTPALTSTQRAGMASIEEAKPRLKIPFEEASRPRWGEETFTKPTLKPMVDTKEERKVVPTPKPFGVREPGMNQDLVRLPGVVPGKTPLPPVDETFERPPFKRPPGERITELPRPPDPVPPAFPGTGGFDLPRGGSRGSPFRGARYRSTAAQYRVGADILGATRGSFQPLRMPKRMSFRMPKF